MIRDGNVTSDQMGPPPNKAQQNKPWRTDEKCGPEYPLVNGRFFICDCDYFHVGSSIFFLIFNIYVSVDGYEDGSPTICNPTSGKRCCHENGNCIEAKNKCYCKKCVDYSRGEI